MPKHALQREITHISDKDFWRNIRVCAKRVRGDVPALRKAIKLGAAGDYGAAYQQLIDHHRSSLRIEWDIKREEALAATPVSAKHMEDMLNHKIQTWTYPVQFGKKIDWMHFGDSGEFHYLTWFTPAVNAFIQTNDERYRDFIIDILTQYNTVHDYPEFDGRLSQSVYAIGKWPHIIAAYMALINTGDVPTDMAAGLFRLIMGIGRAEHRFLKNFDIGSNGEAVCNAYLLHVALVFPEFAESTAWMRQAKSNAIAKAKKGFFSDGGNFERVWGYGVMHLEGLTAPYKLLERYGMQSKSDEVVIETIRRVYDWYAKTTGPPPERWFPTYGDAGVGNTMDNRFPEKSGGALGEARRSPNVDRTKSYLLPVSGFAIMRNGDESGSTYANINFGSHGGWHSHQDLLSMNVWSQGKMLLEEACRFGTYANPWDTVVRAPEYHNLMLIDGMIYDCLNVTGQDVAWHSDDTIDYFSATQRAYRYFVYGREHSGISPNIEGLIRRTVVLVKDPGYLVVLDSVQDISHSGFNRVISQYWHSPFPFKVMGPNAARTQGRQACLVVYGHTDGLHRMETSVDFAGEEDGCSYNRYRLRARRWMPVDYLHTPGFATVIYPFTGKMPEIKVEPLKTAGGAPWRTEALRITTPAGRDTIILNPEKLTEFTYRGKSISARARVNLGGGRGRAVVN